MSSIAHPPDTLQAQPTTPRHAPPGVLHPAPASGHVNGQSRAQGEPYFNEDVFVSGELADDHREILRTESGISDEEIARRGWFTTNDPGVLRFLGFPGSLGRCLVFPTYNYRGERAGYTARPDIAIKKNKYLLPANNPPVLDIDPLTCDQIDDPGKLLIITEGAKKAAAAASRGLAAMSLNGVYGFRGKNHKGGVTALPDWENIALNGRVVPIIYDSDIAVKPGVELALRRLCPFLQRRGAVVKVVYLEPGPNGEKTGLDDYLVRGGDVAGLMAMARDLEPLEDSRRKKREAAKSEKSAKFAATGLPVIETHDRPLPDVLSNLADTIADHNGNAPTLFHGAGGLREVVKNQNGITVLESVMKERLQVISSKGAVWTSTPADAQLPREIAPPSALCQQFIVSREYWRNIPTIKRILTAPFIDRNGNVCQQPGYNATEQIWLSLPDGFTLPDTTPTSVNITAAKTLLIDKLLGDVAFKDQASRANALALMLLPFVRPFIDSLEDGQTPIHLFDAPTQSSGKTFAATTCLAPFCEAVPTSDKKDEKECQKEVFALLTEGTSYIFIDNVKSSLSSPEIATAVTSGKMRGRVLGTGKTETVESNIVWVATSNNAQLDGDTVSRSILIRLDTNSETPEDREYKFNPLQYIAQNKPKVQAAILTLVRAWIDAGKVPRKTKASRFPAWERVIGGILETIEVPDFLANCKDTRQNSDPESAAWLSFVNAWHAAHGVNFKTVKELIETPNGDDLKALIGEKEPTKIFGKELQKRRDKVIAGYKITREADRSRVNRWQLVPTENEVEYI
jgi:hypothetical protein